MKMSKELCSPSYFLRLFLPVFSPFFSIFFVCFVIESFFLSISMFRGGRRQDRRGLEWTRDRVLYISPWVLYYGDWRMRWRLGIDVGFICFSLFSIKTQHGMLQIWCPRINMGVLPTLCLWTILMAMTEELVQQRRRSGKHRSCCLMSGIDANSMHPPPVLTSFRVSPTVRQSGERNCQPLLRNISLFNQGTGFPLHWTAVYREFSIKSLALHPTPIFFFFLLASTG